MTIPTLNMNAVTCRYEKQAVTLPGIATLQNNKLDWAHYPSKVTAFFKDGPL